jgi:hypothetical protein
MRICLKDDIFWLVVLKLEISYRINNILKDFGFFCRIVLKIIFLHGETFEFSIILVLP